MLRLRYLLNILVVSLAVMASGQIVLAQHAARTGAAEDESFGPVMRAYLGYLRNEQEVVDDRVSRREITAGYYRRNSNRIRALREMAVHLVRQTNNDYVPELEAVTQDEFGILFETLPRTTSFHPNLIIANKFRYLGQAHTGEVFYLFARLDPYEQAALMQKNGPPAATGEKAAESIQSGQRTGESTARPRRVVPR